MKLLLFMLMSVVFECVLKVCCKFVVCGRFWACVLLQSRVTHSTISGLEENLALSADKLHKTIEVQGIVQYD
jgi:hypothetical protein